MNGKDVLSVLKFSAFRPEPDDPSAPWKRRFPSARTLLVSFGKAAIFWRAIKANGQPGEGDVILGDPKESLSLLGSRAAELTENGWCGVSLNSRYVISLEANLSRRAGSEEALKSNPRSVLGARHERGKRYAVMHNPETNSSILLTCEEEFIRKLEGQLKETGFQAARICCGTYILLRHALSLTNTNAKSGEKPASFFYIICCQGSVCALVQAEDNWLELRSRPEVYSDDLTPLIDLLTPFQSRITAGMEVVTLYDEPMPELDEKLRKLFFGHKFRDLTQPSILWNLLSQQ